MKTFLAILALTVLLASCGHTPTTVSDSDMSVNLIGEDNVLSVPKTLTPADSIIDTSDRYNVARVKLASDIIYHKITIDGMEFLYIYHYYRDGSSQFINLTKEKAAINYYKSQTPTLFYR